MSVRAKVLISVIVTLLIFIGIILYFSYLGLRGNPEYEAELKKVAQQYLDENFDEKATVVNSFYDGANIYEEFTYAAIAEIENNDDFRILVFYYKDTGEMIDSLVAETWEHELEQYLTPKLNDIFGEEQIEELWIKYPKDVGKVLNISNDDIPSLKGQNANPVIRITLNRKQHDDDEDLIESIANELKEELQIPNGNITLAYNDSGFFFKSKSIIKNF